MSRHPSPDTEPTKSKTSNEQPSTDGGRGKLSVREAGRKGGLRVRELINRGRLAEQRESAPRQ